MRRSSIVVGIITLLLGAAVGYRWGRPGESSAQNRVAAASPIVPSAPAEAGVQVTSAGAAAASAALAAEEVPSRTPRKWGASIEELAKAMETTPSPTPPSQPLAAASTATKATAKPAPPVAQVVPRPASQPPAPAVAPVVAPQTPVKPPATAPTASDDPNADRRPPVLTFFRFDPPQVADGGTAVLSIGVTDDLSGVKSVFGTIRSPSEAALIPFVGQDPSGSGVYTVGITIPKKAETGNWYVGVLQAVDKADNPLNLAYTKANVPPGGILRVSSQDSDSTAPTVHGVTLEKQTIAGGETDRITVAVDDDGSGVGSVAGTFQSPSKSALLPFACTASGEGTWSGSMTLPANAACGEWTLKQLRVADKANNSAVLAGDAPEIGHVAFTVSSGEGCDSEPPVLDQVAVSPPVVSNTSAAQVTLTIMAHDDGSGVAQLTGRVEGPVAANNQVPRIFFSGQADPKNPAAPIVVTITVQQYAATGIWRVGSIEVTDKARNMRRYDGNDPVLVNATVTVQ